MLSMAETSDNSFTTALFAAYNELAALGEQERAIAVRKAQLRQSVNALYPLVFGSAVDINTLSLPDAMRLVLRSAGRALNGHEFMSKLEDIGFDLSKYKDPMANILTAMNRMVEAGEMMWVADAPRKTVEAAPELKPVPDVPSTLPTPDGLDGWLRAAGGLSKTIEGETE